MTDPRGHLLRREAGKRAGKVAFLFPGQGSQYPDMLAQTAMAFPEVRAVLDRAERDARRRSRPAAREVHLSAVVVHAGARGRESERVAANRGRAAGGRGHEPGPLPPARALGIEADYFAGHSYGEYVALAAAGALAEDDLIRLSHRRGRVIRDAAAPRPAE